MRARFPLRNPRPVGVNGLALVLALACSATSRGQETPADASAPARFIPKDGVVIYAEYRGLDSQGDAWKKTAAYKILNETPTGAMLEDVATQLLEKVGGMTKANPRQWAEQVMALTKHVARSGFVWAALANPKDPDQGAAALILRDAFKDKAIRAIMAGYFQTLNAPNTKPQSVVRAGHKVITGVDPKGKAFTWWVDDSKKEDIVLMFEKPEEADAILETLDGKRPSMLEHPRRAEMLKPEGRFLPTGLAFFSTQSFQGLPQFAKFVKDYGYLGIGNLTSVDIRWGFQDEALMTLTRLATSGPRQGLLAFVDSSTFDKGKLPPIPPEATGFSVASIDLAGALDRLRTQAKALTPDADAMVDKLVEQVKEKTKLRLKEDLLAHLGPKVAWYTLPTKKAAGAVGLAGMLGGAMEPLKFAIVIDIDDASAFGKVLDQAMLAVNRELKAMGKPPAEAPAKGARAKAAVGPSLEFRLTPGESKAYVLYIPQEMTGQAPPIRRLAPGADGFFDVPPARAPVQIPPTLRPTIRVGPKHAVIATSPEVARLVLDTKGSWAPPSNLAVAYQALPASLKMLNVSDPRDSLPDLLATLPGKVQQVAALALMARAAQAPPGGGPPPAAPPALVLKIDPAKLPSADSIKSLLFPSLVSVEATGEEVRIVSRDAFPSPGDPSTIAIQAALILPAIQAARDAARRAQNPGMAPPPGAPAPRGAAPGETPGKSKAAAPKAAPGANNPN